MELRRTSRPADGVELFFGGRRHYLNSDRLQILDFHISSCEIAVQRKKELEEAYTSLQDTMDHLERQSHVLRGERDALRQALSEVKDLSGLLPICSSCKKIRDDEGYWNQIESYIKEHSEAGFTHGICPECMKKLYPEFVKDERNT